MLSVLYSSIRYCQPRVCARVYTLGQKMAGTPGRQCETLQIRKDTTAMAKFAALSVNSSKKLFSVGFQVCRWDCPTPKPDLLEVDAMLSSALLWVFWSSWLRKYTIHKLLVCNIRIEVSSAFEDREMLANPLGIVYFDLSNAVPNRLLSWNWTV